MIPLFGSLCFSAQLFAETHLSSLSLPYAREAEPSSSYSWYWLLVPVVAALAAGIAHHVSQRNPPVLNTPLGLLHELCNAHRVNGKERSLLEQIAETIQMQRPATLFTSKNQFDTAIEQAEGKITYSAKQKTMLGSLRRRIHGI